jgi:hypothetical protein
MPTLPPRFMQLLIKQCYQNAKWSKHIPSNIKLYSNRKQMKQTYIANSNSTIMFTLYIHIRKHTKKSQLKPNMWFERWKWERSKLRSVREISETWKLEREAREWNEHRVQGRSKCKPFKFPRKLRLLKKFYHPKTLFRH